MVMKQCTICDRQFKKTEHFKRHERSHTKEKPYQCKVCLKRFSRSDVLSRHAKGHKTTRPETTNESKNIQTATPPTQPPNDRTPLVANGIQQALPGMSPHDIQQIQNVSTHRGMSLSATPGIPSTSLDFLANLSTHQPRTEPDANPMMPEEQHQYFGWNDISGPDQQCYRGTILDPMQNDLLQFWLEPRGDSISHSGSLDMMGDQMSSLTGEISTATPQQHPQQHQSVSDGENSKSGNLIPNERFSRVQRYWLAPSNNTGRLMNSLWRDVASSDLHNIFTMPPTSLPIGPVGLPQGSRYGLDEACRQRLYMAFGQTEQPQPHALAGSNILPPLTSNSHPKNHNFPPAEVLDMALDLYFREFHPLVPFIHVPTFSASNTRPSVLYAMCLIGMVLLGTRGTMEFVCKNFQLMLERITTDLAKCSVGVENSVSTVSTFAACFLFLNLAAMTGEKEHLKKCQMLYVNLIAIAQRHGLFAATEGQLLDMNLFDTFPDVETRWKVWSKVESVKRLINGLLLLDSWYSSFMSTSPIIVPDSVQLILPCDDALFRAITAMRWMQLICSGKCMLMPTIVAPSESVGLPELESPVDDFCMHGVLSLVQLRLSEAYYRLLSNRPQYPFAPCHTYNMDARARCLADLQLQIANKYGDILSRLNPNAAVTWHNMCLTLSADTQIFDLAAGRSGPAPARKALDDIAAWSQTPAARRACLHAAHIYKVLTNRKTSDHMMFHSVFSLFSAALVLGLYVFMVPNLPDPQGGGTAIELFDDIDWQKVGTEGLASYMVPSGNQPLPLSEEPAVNFIRNGGTVFLRGIPIQGGYQPARRVLLDYAGLLRDAGKWSVRKFSYVLHIMSDVLMDVD
ncbi:FTFMHR domain-containing protein [Aspergillus saccharolyticus JOP 1030-1]|uniref:C2H2-type domain-containing protein n=1 Tax=Aspergillus saccharolyticus JOP 1030-1 TaxID=1450539 RepID=A0A318Z344_9EURO|nr:hypothetical protein BP01DRAFT_168012 [Aspergillus saccharolyticus JOP 1030-1]PYH41409.1 hypothetical protein BP01DRAFT_168012 [Aspergillus saccharolyticus JOP 1030-1]